MDSHLRILQTDYFGNPCWPLNKKNLNKKKFDPLPVQDPWQRRHRRDSIRTRRCGRDSPGSCLPRQGWICPGNSRSSRPNDERWEAKDILNHVCVFWERICGVTAFCTLLYCTRLNWSEKLPRVLKYELRSLGAVIRIWSVKSFKLRTSIYVVQDVLWFSHFLIRSRRTAVARTSSPRPRETTSRGVPATPTSSDAVPTECPLPGVLDR